MRKTLFILSLLTALASTSASASAQPDPITPFHAPPPVSEPAEDVDEADLEADDLFAWFAEGDESAWADHNLGADARDAHMRRGPGRGMHGPMGHGMRHGGTGPRRGMAMRGRGAMGQLDLSDAQREKMRELHADHRRQAIQRRADLEVARLDLRELIRGERPQRAAIDAQIDKLSRLQAEQHKARVHTMLEARAVLTPAQQQQLREQRQQRPGLKSGPGKQSDRRDRRPSGPGVRRNDGTIDHSQKGGGGTF